MHSTAESTIVRWWQEKTRQTIHPTHLVIGCIESKATSSYKKERNLLTTASFFNDRQLTNRPIPTIILLTCSTYCRNYHANLIKYSLEFAHNTPLCDSEFVVYKLYFTCYRSIANSLIAIENKAMSCK